MATDRCILHVDMDAFYASIEQRDCPELRGKPVVVGSPPDQRGVVAAASYEAREFGIFSAMPSVQAGRRCEHAVFVPVRMERYQAVSKDVMDILADYTPLLEKLSVDEAFLDVTGSRHLFGSGAEMAESIRERISHELELTASVGVAPNKYLAKLASDMNKPDGVTVVPTDRDEILAFLAPLPVARIWGVGKVSQEKLSKVGIHTIGELQAVPKQQLEAWVGANFAGKLWALSRGVDGRKVETERVEKSISNETTFATDCSDMTTLHSTMVRLAEKVGGRLRAAKKFAGTVQIKVRTDQFDTITRQQAMRPASCKDTEIISSALRLLEGVKIRRPIRLIGVGVSQLVSDPIELESEQLDLFAPPPKAEVEPLDAAMDEVRKNFGSGSIRRAGGLDEG